MTFEHFQKDYCKHQGATLNFDGEDTAVKACSYKNLRPAQSWADWQRCTEENCPFMKELKEWKEENW